MTSSLDRRADTGYKVTIAVLISTVGLLLGLFAHAAWATASKGYDLAITNALKIERLLSIETDVAEIKSILKRGVPKSAFP